MNKKIEIPVFIVILTLLLMCFAVGGTVFAILQLKKGKEFRQNTEKSIRLLFEQSEIRTGTNIQSSGAENLFIGFAAGKENSGGANTFIGNKAGALNTTGKVNAFFGTNAGSKNTTGYYNSFIGATAGRVNTTGYENTLVG
jgi:hypothetical protein